MEMFDYYKTLEVDRRASAEVIEKAYKTLAKKYHPDLHPNKNNDGSENKMRRLNEAYLVLKDPAKRRYYDETCSPPIDIWLSDGLVGLLRQWLIRRQV